MIKYYPKLARVLLKLAILSFLAGCNPNSQIAQNVSCDSVFPPSCLTITMSHSVFTFDGALLISEVPYNVSISSVLPIESVTLTPLNMEMGALPLFLQRQPEIELKKSLHYKSLLNFGLCAEPVMQWRLSVVYENGQVDNTIIKSYWSEDYIIN